MEQYSAMKKKIGLQTSVISNKSTNKLNKIDVQLQEYDKPKFASKSCFQDFLACKNQYSKQS